MEKFSIRGHCLRAEFVSLCEQLMHYAGKNLQTTGNSHHFFPKYGFKQRKDFQSKKTINKIF